MGAAARNARRQGHPHRRARHPARQAPEADGTSSSTPGRSRVSSRKACSRPNSAGARTRNGCRTTAARTRPAAARRSICSSPAPTPACAPGARRPAPQYGFLVTHNESISIADYLHAPRGGKAVYRPTCHYAYHPANDAVLSLHELFGRAGKMPGRAPHPRRERDRRRHRRTRRAALRPREERLLVRLAALRSTRRATSRPIRTPPACR